MIRQAVKSDISSIANTYDELLQYEQNNINYSNWQLGIYPTIDVARDKVAKSEMYILIDQNQLCASMGLNQDQAVEYRKVPWNTSCDDSDVLVIHTLCIPPRLKGRGYATQMINFAREFGRANNYKVIRLDTFAHNEPAKQLYTKNGFIITFYGEKLLNGVILEPQV